MKKGCPCRPAKWFFWKYFKPHNWVVYKVYKFMLCSDDFRVLYRCPHCECEQEAAFTSREDLLKMGFKKEQIEGFAQTVDWQAKEITEPPTPI